MTQEVDEDRHRADGHHRRRRRCAGRPHDGPKAVHQRLAPAAAAQPRHVQGAAGHGRVGRSPRTAQEHVVPGRARSAAAPRRRARPAGGPGRPAARSEPAAAEVSPSSPSAATQARRSAPGWTAAVWRSRAATSCGPPSRPSATARASRTSVTGRARAGRPQLGRRRPREAAPVTADGMPRRRGSAGCRRSASRSEPAMPTPMPLEGLGGRPRRDDPLGRLTAPRAGPPRPRGSPSRPSGAGRQRGPPARGRPAAWTSSGTCRAPWQQAEQVRRAGAAHRASGRAGRGGARSTSPWAWSSATRGPRPGRRGPCASMRDDGVVGRAPGAGPASSSARHGGSRRRPRPRRRRAAGAVRGDELRRCVARGADAAPRVSTMTSSEGQAGEPRPAARPGPAAGHAVVTGATRIPLTRCSSSRGLNGLMT